MTISFEDYLDGDGISAVKAALVNNGSLRLKDLNPNDSTVKTHSIGPRAIADTDFVEGSVSNLPEITGIPAEANRVSNAALEAGILEEAAPSKGFSSNLAWETLKAGLAREKFGNAKLEKHSKDIKVLLKNIDDLLDLSAAFTDLKEKESLEISDKMRKMITDLKENGIEVCADLENKVSTAQIEKIKSQISSKVDSLRTKLQTIITTEVQPELNNLRSIMDILKDMIETDRRLKKHANDNSTK